MDLGQCLRSSGLDVQFPVSSWPPMGAVRELATKVKQLKRGMPDRQSEPYANAELKKCVPISLLRPGTRLCGRLVTCVRFLPSFYPEAVAVKTGEEVEGKKPPPVGLRRLELAAWQVAWDRWVVAAGGLCA